MDVETQPHDLSLLTVATVNEEDRLKLQSDILDHLSSNETAHFTNKVTGEREVNKDEKRNIAKSLLLESYGLFLARFGTHLQEKHLVYFDTNVSKDEKCIVDVHLKQLRKLLSGDSDKANSTKSSEKIFKMDMTNNLNPLEQKKFELRNSILDHLSLSKKAHFKSQQVGELELNMQQKRNIAEELLDRSKSLFLSRFGTHLEEKHLSYFEGNNNEESYEIEFYLKQLRRNHCKAVSKVDIKNRRFEALRQMLDEGSYFGETEMRKRNPLLYEQMIGQYLTDDEKREREDIDTTNITFVNLLLEQIDRDAEKKLKHQQEEAEDNVMEEEDTSDEEEETEKKTPKKYKEKEDSDIDQTLWGESYTDREVIAEPKQSPPKETKPREIPELSESEKQLLMEEFRSNMFESFLQGNDANFDYSQVDFNPDYDDLIVRGLDEEEKYFDAESPEEVSQMELSEEDELDQYMVNLKPEPTTDQLADQMKDLVNS